MSKQISNATAVVPSPRFINWPRTDTRPTPPLVRLSFTGLSMFTYNRAQKRCEIGFLKIDDGKHILRLRAYEYDPSTPQIQIPVQLPVPTSMMTIGLQNTTSEVKFLELEQASRYDFKNMLDLNNKEFWPGKKLKENKLKPKLIVNNGTFLCLELTKKKFDRVRVPLLAFERFQLPDEHQELNYILKIAGAEIGLANNQKVAVTVDSGNPILLPNVNGRSVEIEFDNDCKDNGDECDFDPRSRFETRRGDFHFHRKALSVNILDKKYGLSLAAGELPPDGVDVSTKKVPPFGTDLAPCMAAGAGEEPGLPKS